MVDYHLTKPNVAYLGCLRVDSQEIRGHHVYRNVHYGHVDKAHGIILFHT